MELCKEVQAEEYVIPVVEARTGVHTYLRFSLLASSWFPRALGVFVWSVLHMILVVFIPLVLLGLFTLLLVLAIFLDAFALLIAYLCIYIPVTLVWIWLVISCECCTFPMRSPGQSMADYIRRADVCPTPPSRATAQPPGEGSAEGGTAANDEELECCIKELPPMTVMFLKHVALVSFPYWSLSLKSFCGEVVPLYDAVVV